MTAKLAIGDVVQRSGVAATTLRYYERIGLLPAPDRVGGARRYDPAVLTRLAIVELCKAAGFTLEQIGTLFDDGQPGRPTSRALARAKLVDIDAGMAELVRARRIVEWAMSCTCRSIDDCTCGIHPPPAFVSPAR